MKTLLNAIKRIVFLGIIGARGTVLLIATASAETTLERAKKLGYIRVGFASEAPFGFATPDGKLTGEAPEVAKAILKKTGISEVDGVLTRTSPTYHRQTSSATNDLVYKSFSANWH
jgi:polar amino acid transport system substrate-binding protein